MVLRDGHAAVSWRRRLVNVLLFGTGWCFAVSALFIQVRCSLFSSCLQLQPHERFGVYPSTRQGSCMPMRPQVRTIACPCDLMPGQRHAHASFSCMPACAISRRFGGSVHSVPAHSGTRLNRRSTCQQGMHSSPVQISALLHARPACTNAPKTNPGYRSLLLGCSRLWSQNKTPFQRGLQTRNPCIPPPRRHRCPTPRSRQAPSAAAAPPSKPSRWQVSSSLRQLPYCLARSPCGGLAGSGWYSWP